MKHHNTTNETKKKKAIIYEALASVLDEEGIPSSDLDAINNNNNVTEDDARAWLGDILIASNRRWKQKTLSLLDHMWQTESSKRRSIISAKNLDIAYKVNNNNNNTATATTTATATATATDISIWRGDITQLKIGAIVNAANDQGLGCFQPSHTCIDNIIHRQAGPRLRLACQDAMHERDGSLPLAAGTKPIVTNGFYLPASKVIHVTGPQILLDNDDDHNNNNTKELSRSVVVTDDEQKQLALAYSNSLDAAVEIGVRSIAFPCISTGLFGFPSVLAAEIALATVLEWLATNPAGHQIDHVVFDVFSSNDEEIYRSRLDEILYDSHKEQEESGTVFTKNHPNGDMPKENEEKSNSHKNELPTVGSSPPLLLSPWEQSLKLAKYWIDQADSVLLVAGAGMSVKPGEMVYTNPDDFARHYPWFAHRWGYKTSYECMGLFNDPKVPDTAKWALYAKHMDNMRWKFTPNQGYDALRQLLVGHKDYFVLTSNVDGCFERSGFDPNRIYTPQGEWTYLQCTGGNDGNGNHNRPCALDSVYESRPILDNILPHISTRSTGEIPKEFIPHCPRCGSKMFGNVRGGNWFLHHDKYQKQNEALQTWMKQQLAKVAKAKVANATNGTGHNGGGPSDSRSSNGNPLVVVLEIGAGFNTPTVTRFPAESFARELGDYGPFIRINPYDPEIPNDLKHAVAIPDGWEALLGITMSSLAQTTRNKDNEYLDEQQELEMETRKYQQLNELLVSAEHQNANVLHHFGSLDWRDFIDNLKAN